MSQTVKISDDLHEALRKRAQLEQRTIAMVVQRAFVTYVEAEPHPIEPRSIRVELAEFVENPEDFAKGAGDFGKRAGEC